MRPTDEAYCHTWTQATRSVLHTLHHCHKHPNSSMRNITQLFLLFSACSQPLLARACNAASPLTRHLPCACRRSQPPQTTFLVFTNTPMFILSPLHTLELGFFPLGMNPPYNSTGYKLCILILQFVHSSKKKKPKKKKQTTFLLSQVPYVKPPLFPPFPQNPFLFYNFFTACG